MTRQLCAYTQADRIKRKFSFFATSLLKDKIGKETVVLNFLSGFLFNTSFSTFASCAFLFVEKITNKSSMPFEKLTKELSPARSPTIFWTKTPAQKFSFAPTSWIVLCISTVLFSIDTCIAQSLYEKTQQQIQNSMLQKYADRDRMNEMKMMKANFPGMAPSIEQQMNQILQWYSPVNNNNNPKPDQDIINQQNR